MGPTLNELWHEAWSLLAAGQLKSDHPYHTPVVSTISGHTSASNHASLHPRARLIVLRECNQQHGELWCYTDKRSQKALDLRHGNTVMSWTFWDPEKRIQFTGSGPTDWLEEEKAKERFQKLPKHSRKAYATLQPPGTPLNKPGGGLPADWEERPLVETAYAFSNFGILRTKLKWVEILRLGRKEHLRLRAVRQNESWELNWIVP